MIEQLTGKKLNMTQVFLDSGEVVPVTIIDCENKVHNEFENIGVTVVGTSKGKGFAGVMKKWGFHGSQATRGQKHDARKPGAIGAQTPGRVFKGKKMAGRTGGTRVTVKGLRIVKVLPEEGKVMVSGAVPGARNSAVLIKFTKPVEISTNESTSN